VPAWMLKRAALGLSTILGVVTLTFLLLHVFGGDPAVAFLGPSASAAELAELRAQHGFDRPLALQLLELLRQLVTLELGTSFVTRRPVVELLAERAGPSLSLGLPVLVVGTLTAVGLALVAARHRGRLLDRSIVAGAVLATSTSVLVYIVVGQWLLAYALDLFPIHGWDPGWGARWAYLALPMLIFVVVGLGWDVQLYRAVVLDELSKDYVVAARAKGRSARAVLLLHVLPNAAIPIVTRVVGTLPYLVTGSLLLESYFGIPGLGTMLLDAIDQADLPVIRAYTLLVSILFVCASVATDLLYGLVDPRTRPQ
jgi:peptide/nickel transport system permease protein